MNESDVAINVCIPTQATGHESGFTVIQPGKKDVWNREASVVFVVSYPFVTGKKVNTFFAEGDSTLVIGNKRVRQTSINGTPA